MIKCKYFHQTKEYDAKGLGSIVYSPMYNFNKWDQEDVKTIYSINPTYNNNGDCVQILVFYEAIED